MISTLHIKNIGSYIMEGNIVTLDKKYMSSKDYNVLNNIILDVLGDDNE